MKFKVVALILAASFVVGFAISTHVGEKENVKRCMNLYLASEVSMFLLLDQDIEAAAKKQGFSGTEDMVRYRCETWVKNGQKF